MFRTISPKDFSNNKKGKTKIANFALTTPVLNVTMARKNFYVYWL